MIEAGARIADRFEILARVAAGGMGTVYRARDGLTGNVAAVKIVQPASRDAALRLLDEAAILARLDHPGIVRYVAHGPAGGDDLYLAMEWLDGEDLSARLARGPLSIGDAVTLGRAIAEALGAAHACGVVHRDMKPSNLFLPGGDVARVKLLDFGIARQRGNRAITRTGIAIGTPGYMAPEQVSGEGAVDGRTDVFALGCVLYEALAGRPAFAGDSPIALLAKVLVEDPPPLGALRPDAAGPLEALIGRMLAKAPPLRPANGAAVAEELAALPALVDGLPPPALATPRALTDEERWLVNVILVGEAGDATTLEALRDTAPQDVAALRDAAAPRDAEERVRRAVAPFLGRAEPLGDGTIVVTLLGIGTATDQAVHAARAALSIRAVVPEMKIALATGRSASTMSAGATGEAIDRAAALLPRAPSGGVLVDDLTAGLVDGRFEVARAEGGGLLGAEREWFEEPRTLLGKKVPCVGREREIGALLGVWEECLEEQVARAVLVTGAPGVGKSRLRSEVLRRAREREPRARVLLCQGDPVAAAAPYSLLGPALRRAMGVAHGEPAAAAQAKVRAAAARVPEPERERVASVLGELMGVPFPETDHPWLAAARVDSMVHADQVRRAWEDFVQAEGAAAPWIVVVEDLHWGDPPSVQLLDAALRRGGTPLFVAALARPEVLAVFPELWAGRGVTRMELLGLSPRAGARLVREVLGAEADDAKVAAIVDEAGGNALYLEELVRAAASAEAGEQALEPSPLSAGGRRLRPPKTVTAMVQSRIEVLAPAERRALRAGSVLGGSFWLEAVDRLLGGAEGLVRLDATLRRLVDMEVLVRCERSHLEGKRQYAFRHGLLRDAAYAMLTEEDRALGHRLAAAFLEEAGEPEAAVIAEHHLRGGERAAAAIWYRRAAEQALDANDLAGAIERAERAASCGAEGEELGAVRLRQAEACSYLGDAARTRARALEAIALLPEGSGPWGMAVAHAATAAQRLGHNDQAVEMAERLLERAAQPSPPRALLIAAARVAGNICNAGRPDLCERMLRAIRAARGAGEGAMGGFGSPAARDAGQGAMGGFGSPAARDAGQGAMGGFGSPQNQALRGDPLLTARVLTAEGQLRLAAGPLDRAIEVSREAAAIFERVGDHRAACSVRVNVGFSLMTLGAYDEAAAVLEATLAEADRMHLLSAAAAVRHNLGLVRALAGDADEGLRLERAAAEAYAARGDRRMESAARAYVALILELRGDLPGALAEASAAVKAAEPGSEEHALALAVQARLFVRDGDAAQALAAAREAAALREGRAPMHEGEVTVRLALAEARHLSGDLEGARAAIAEARDMVSAQARALESDSRRATFLARVPENARVLSLAREWLSEEG